MMHILLINIRDLTRIDADLAKGGQGRCQQATAEAREKLGCVRPSTLGQASRVSGIGPADVGAIMVWLRAVEETTS